MNLFQSTHPHGVRLHAPGSVWVPLSVSIHAPARGATNTVLKAFDRSGVSIHAPARGATGVCARLAERVRVSIHAPARGATVALANSPSIFIPFQSTHPHGVRQQFGCKCHNSFSLFQSTHPHGVRRVIVQSCLRYFRVSIHAPARGATVFAGLNLSRNQFQSTHPHGVRPK